MKPLVDRLADSLLYEGYILYPYRPSAVKNRQRFNFGVLVPRPCGGAAKEERTAGEPGDSFEPNRGGDAWSMQTECLLRGAAPHVTVRVRWLQPILRRVARRCRGGDATSHSSREFVSRLEVDGQSYETWQEAVEREVSVRDIDVEQAASTPWTKEFDFPAEEFCEPIRDAGGVLAGEFVRVRRRLTGSVEVSAEPIPPSLWRIRCIIANLTPGESLDPLDREDLLLSSLASTHTILEAADSEFVSLLEPPDEFQAAVSACRNVGTWPVLVGEAGGNDRRTMLSSPIILYDYPQLAPESPGDFFDCTEIDEMLMLRVMTLTDDEKREMGRGDAFARRILARAEALPNESMRQLHGTVRGMTSVVDTRSHGEE